MRGHRFWVRAASGGRANAFEITHGSSAHGPRPFRLARWMMAVTNNLQSSRGSRRLAHGRRLADRTDVSEEIIREFIRPAVRAVPSALAARLKSCRISL